MTCKHVLPCVGNSETSIMRRMRRNELMKRVESPLASQKLWESSYKVRF